MIKESIIKAIGMNRDLSATTFDSKFAYEIKNMRLYTEGDNSMLALTSEKSLKDLNIELQGIALGHAVFNDFVVIFTHKPDVEKPDYIYLITNERGIYNTILYYNGNLNFKLEYPIEALGYYESTDIKKVYWTDNYNPLRVANLDKTDGLNDNSFDFQINYNNPKKITIEKLEDSNGMFPSGTVQYVLTYYNKYMQESPIIYYSPIFYSSPSQRGGSPEESCNNAFSIMIEEPDRNFEYIRIYSIVRTSLDATPTVKIVSEIKLNDFQAAIAERVTSTTLNDPKANLLFNDDLASIRLNVEDVEGNQKSIDLNFRGDTLKDKVENMQKALLNQESEYGFYQQGLPLGFGGIYIKNPNPEFATEIKTGFKTINSYAFNGFVPLNPSERYKDPRWKLMTNNTENIETYFFKAAENDWGNPSLLSGVEEAVKAHYDETKSMAPYSVTIDKVWKVIALYIEDANAENPIMEALIIKDVLYMYPVYRDWDASSGTYKEYLYKDLEGTTIKQFLSTGKSPAYWIYEYNTNTIRPCTQEDLDNYGIEGVTLPQINTMKEYVGTHSEESEKNPNPNDIPDNYTVSLNHNFTGYFLNSIEVSTSEYKRKFYTTYTANDDGSTSPVRLSLDYTETGGSITFVKFICGYYQQGSTGYSFEEFSNEGLLNRQIYEDTEYAWVFDEQELSALTFIDTNTTGETIDPTSLLYLDLPRFSAKTLINKDGRLFIGNIHLLQDPVYDKVDYTAVRDLTVNFIKDSSKNKLSLVNNEGIYPYESQLKYSSYDITTFKSKETYRFGIQLQDNYGRWSDVLYIGDFTNNGIPDINNLYSAQCPIPTTLCTQFINAGYKAIRPVAVYPQITERNCLYQGIVCPTMFNLEDRYNNNPFGFISWFSRPNPPSFTSTDQYIRQTSFTGSSYMEFRNYGMIPDNNSSNGEVQSLYGNHGKGFINTDAKDNYEYLFDQDYNVNLNAASGLLSTYGQSFFVDSTICSIHSPEIEWDDSLQNIDLSNVKFRIVGFVPIDSSITYIDIDSAGTRQFNSDVNIGGEGTTLNEADYKNLFGIGQTTKSWVNYAEDAYKMPIAVAIWKDYEKAGTGWDATIQELEHVKLAVPTINYSYLIYPWQRNGALNDVLAQDSGNGDQNVSNNINASKLNAKASSYFKVSYVPAYISSIWTHDINNCYIYNGVNDSDSNANALGGFLMSDNAGIDSKGRMFYSNLDKVSTINTNFKQIDYGINGDSLNSPLGLLGYPILRLKINGSDNNYSESDTEVSPRGTFNFDNKIDASSNSAPLGNYDSTPVPISFRANPYSLIEFTHGTNSAGYISLTSLPSPSYLTPLKDKFTASWINEMSESSTRAFVMDNVDVSSYLQGLNNRGYLWLGEVYKDSSVNRFGGTSIAALENNRWLIAGNSVDINNAGTIVTWKQGDTYLQRYDALRIEPMSNGSINQMTDIVSFICETHINIDGRYDKNRGRMDNTSMRHTNFNLLNEAYSQMPNFFIQHYVDPEDNTIDYPTQIWYSMLKNDTEDVDTWTKIMGSSYVTIDGNKGDLNALKKYNNNIFSFQDTGIAQILYNESMQFSTTQGVPIEIANSGAVNGIRYISEKIGCVNKYAMCDSPLGIYFMDDINSDIYLFNGQFNGIASTKGFSSWIIRKSSIDNIWDATLDNKGKPRLFYDNDLGEVIYVDKDDCLIYSETLQTFTSFYSYEEGSKFFNFKDRGIWLNYNSNNTYLYEYRGGDDYNHFFHGYYEPYHITYLVNPDPQEDKVFNNVEFRADVLVDNKVIKEYPFDHIKVWNEYQEGEENLSFKYTPSNLKQKFRIWRANIPRDKTNKMDRIRNPWVMIKLSHEEELSKMTILQGTIVKYFS